MRCVSPYCGVEPAAMAPAMPEKPPLRRAMQASILSQRSEGQLRLLGRNLSADLPDHSAGRIHEQGTAIHYAAT